MCEGALSRTANSTDAHIREMTRVGPQMIHDDSSFKCVQQPEMYLYLITGSPRSMLYSSFFL